MKKLISYLLSCLFIFNFFGSAKAATQLQSEPDRYIEPIAEATRHAFISGESPTTGLPWNGTSSDYLPMLVQIDNTVGTEKINGKSIKSAGIGERAPWGGQFADIVFEGVLYRAGATRISFLFSDSFMDGQPRGGVGPVRSARIGHVLLREEWEAGFVYAGGPRVSDNNIRKLFAETGANQKGVLFDLLSGSFADAKYRVKGLKSPNNMNADVLRLREMIPSDYVATPRPFLFTDSNPYSEGYKVAYSISLDWGDKNYASHFVYDEAENLYLRYSGSAPYMTFAAAEDRSSENEEQLSFSNVIIQRIEYEYVNNSKIMPDMQSVGQGNADIFVGGRYIPGYWVRKAVTEPTVFYDDNGNELQLSRGKTFIAHFPPDRLCAFAEN